MRLPPGYSLEYPVLPLDFPKFFELLRSREVKFFESACDPDEWSLSRVPIQLVPFLRTLDPDVLACLLQEDPILYWHPLVRAEMEYLSRACSEEMRRASLRKDYPQGNVEVAYGALEKILEIHSRFLHPGKGIMWKPVPRKRGPRGLPNPHSTSPKNEWVEPDILYKDWAVLRKKLAALRAEFPALPVPEEARDRTKESLQRLADRALNATPITWSGLHEGIRSDGSIDFSGSHPVMFQYSADAIPLRSQGVA